MLPSAPAESDGDRAEHLLVLAWRMLVAGRARCPMLHEQLAAEVGDHAMGLLSVLSVFLMTLGNGNRRRLSVGPSGMSSPHRRRTGDADAYRRRAERG
ncbi:MAG: hypothetical protein WDM86_00935 [Rhizomicrobium sp.]